LSSFASGSKRCWPDGKNGHFPAVDLKEPFCLNWRVLSGNKKQVLQTPALNSQLNRAFLRLVVKQ